MRRNAVLALILGALAAAPAAAQTTGTPIFLAPYMAGQRSELSGYVTDPGSGFTVEGMYRLNQRSYDLGFRAGIGDSDPGPTVFLVGVDFRTTVVRATESFPLDGALTVGLGANFADGTSIGYVPVGISLGREVNVEGSRTSFTPYVHPVLTPTFGDGPDDVEFGLGLGVNIKFTPRFEVRVAGGIGDLPEGVSVGMAFLN